MTEKALDIPKEKLQQTIDDIYKAIKAIKAYNSKIIDIDPPITLSLTLDDTWNTYDFTSETSANAKGVFLGVYLARDSGANYTGYLYTAKYNNTAFEGIVYGYFDSANGFKIGGTIRQGIDSQQRMNYCGSQAATTHTVKLLGYWE